MSYSKEHVLAFLRRAETVAIGTSTGTGVRLRMMHFGVDDNFNLYLSSLKGDPKVIQWINIPETAALIHIHPPGDFPRAEEVEIIGRATLVRDPVEYEKAVSLVAPVSPFVSHLKSIGALDRLEFIRITPHEVKYRFVSDILQGKPPTVFDLRPDQEESAWDDLKRKARAWKESIRILSLTGALVPVLVGTAYSFAVHGVFQPWWFVLTLLGALLLQAGSNLINDWKDAVDSDAVNREYVRPFTGGSRVIQMGLLTRADVGLGGFTMLGLASLIGLYLAYVRGWPVLLLLAAGLIGGIYYTGAGKQFSFITMGPAVGEIVLGLCFGVLLLLGTVYVQTGTFTLEAFLLSLPVTLLIVNVLLINQFADAEADEKVGKTTLTVRLGKQRTVSVLTLNFVLSYVVIAASVLAGYMPLAALLVGAAIPFTVQAILYARRYYDKSTNLVPANAFTAMTHLVAGIGLSIGYVAVGLGESGLVYTGALALAGIAFIWWVWAYIERQRKTMTSLQEAFRT